MRPWLNWKPPASLTLPFTATRCSTPAAAAVAPRPPGRRNARELREKERQRGRKARRQMGPLIIGSAVVGVVEHCGLRCFAEGADNECRACEWSLVFFESCKCLMSRDFVCTTCRELCAYLCLCVFQYFYWIVDLSLWLYLLLVELSRVGYVWKYLKYNYLPIIIRYQLKNLKCHIY